MLQDKASRGQTGTQDQAGQQLHVSGVFIVILELALVIENTLPILVVVKWLPSCARGVGDRLIAAFSVTCIMSALIPTPLGLASYFSGSWYGGSPTCDTYQVTSIWCNLSSLALLAYICINCRFAVKRLVNLKLTLPIPSRAACTNINFQNMSLPTDINSLPSTTVTASQDPSNSVHMLPSPSRSSNGHLDLDSLQNVDISMNATSLAERNRLCDGEKSTEHERQSQREEVVGRTPDFSNSNGAPYIQIEHQQNFGEIPENHMAHSTEDTSDRIHTECTYTADNQRNNTEAISSNYEQPSNTAASNRESSCLDQSAAFNLYNTKYMLRNPLIYEDSTFIYTQSLNSEINRDQTTLNSFRPRDYVSLVLFFMYSITLAISSLPVVGFGPQHRTNEKMCNSWLFPTPTSTKERAFFILFLVFVYLCLLLGCASGAEVCYMVNRRLRQEAQRTSRLYHEEENIPDIREFSILDDLKRHYSLACLVMSGILTWVPIVVMLTLQKSGLNISEATLVYSNIATSLPGLLNPLLYSLVLVRYRDGYKAVFEKCCRKKGQYRQHPMKTVGNHRDSDDLCEISVATSTDGHQTLHCRPNPNFDNSRHFATDLADDDDDDEDCFYEDQDDLIQQETQTARPKLSEKTPLHASSITSTSLTSSADVKTFHAAARYWSQSVDQSNRWDEDCLLAHEISCQDDETGL